jgi:L-fuconolactonase
MHGKAEIARCANVAPSIDAALVGSTRIRAQGVQWAPTCDATPRGIDAHVHLISYNPLEHDWVTEELRALRRDFLLEELKPLLTGAGFGGCVAVEARQIPAENAFLLELAQPPSVVAAVVGWVDLLARDVADRVQEWAQHPQFVGVRHVLIDEADDQYMLRPEFQRGLSALAAADLCYDLLIAPRHFASAVAVVDAHPDVRFVLDHAGLPDVRGGGLDAWLPGLTELARRPNVACKLSALELMADWGEWTGPDLRPYQEAILEAFGPARIMIGSNWPVCTVAGGYPRAIGASLVLLEQLSVDERAAILGGTCQRWYRFGDEPGC